MMLKNQAIIGFIAIVSFCASLRAQNDNKIISDDQQVYRDQTTDALSLVPTLEAIAKARNEYMQKNTTALNIKCKGCNTKLLSYVEFEGGLVGWALKALGEGSERFKITKTLLDNCIKLLSEQASSAELINFMLHVSNDMKQICSHCHGVSWEKNS